MLEASSEVELGLLCVAELLAALGADQPQLGSVLLRNRIEHVIENLEGLLEVLLSKAADHRVVAVLVNVQRTEADIRQICLAARIARVVCSSSAFQVLLVGELVSRVKHLVRMHNL